MGGLQRVGRNEQMEKDLYLAVVDDLSAWSPGQPDFATPFTVFCALDAKGVDDRVLETFAARLVALDCRYACAWGPDCDRVHDAFDEARPTPEPESDFLGTTWHDDESLDDALWFAIFCAALEYAAMPTVLSICSPVYAEHVEQRLADSVQLNRDVVERENGGRF